MDRRCISRRFLTGAVLAGALALAPVAAELPLRAARWLPPERAAYALTREPTECLLPPADTRSARRLAIGRAAFRTPLLLGGQAARVGLSCNSCHRNGRGNPDFLFRGLSGAPGTADVTSSLMSRRRGDGRHNPAAIPDLSGQVRLLRVSKGASDRALETFIHGLVVEEFDGPEPSTLTIDSLAHYVRMLSPDACPPAPEKPTRLADSLSSARAAAQAALFALDAKDPATARLMLTSVRSELGLIAERYAGSALTYDRQLLSEADRELMAIQSAIDLRKPDTALRIARWLAKVPRWSRVLVLDEPRSLFNRDLL